MHTLVQQKHTVRRDGNLYYNRRVPAHAQVSYGKTIRIRLDDEASADLLTQRLDAIWQQEDVGTAVNLLSLLGATNTRPRKLSEIADEYVALKGIQENPTISSVRMLAALSGDISVDAYLRQDARNFVSSMLSQGNKTTSIRRRLNCLTAVFNYAYSEYDFSGHNPFSQVRIAKEGMDASKRIPFLADELAELYADHLSNFQALCMTCNTNKRDTDDTDFRAILNSYDNREVGCIFCDISAGRIESENELCYSIKDAFPVTELHTLIIPKRHASDYFDLYQPERNAIDQMVQQQRKVILDLDSSVTGFNVGMNVGQSAGQTVFHVHVHLIPRRDGDVAEPRGGVRGVIPSKQRY